jgi:uncharacterized protein (DUF2225 family)
MCAYNFTQPLCLSCGIALEDSLEYDQINGVIYSLKKCPICGEVFNKEVTGG